MVSFVIQDHQKNAHSLLNSSINSVFLQDCNKWIAKMFVAFLPSIIKIQDHFKRFQEVKSIVKSSFESHERIF